MTCKENCYFYDLCCEHEGADFIDEKYSPNSCSFFKHKSMVLDIPRLFEEERRAADLGRVTIPKHYREKLKIKSGDRLGMTMVDGYILMYKEDTED